VTACDWREQDIDRLGTPRRFTLKLSFHFNPHCTEELEDDPDADAVSQQDKVEDDECQLVCCCLCYCAVDYSDKSYFCQDARDADSDLEGDQPLLLPMELYDPNNALVFCDTCDRPYHQRCHFVPAIHLPRGDWHCFICTSSSKMLEGKNRWTKKQLREDIYKMDAPAGDMELQWEYDTRNAKLHAFKAEMRRVKGGLSQQLQSIRLADMALKAFTTSRRKTSTESMLKSQELRQTLVKVTSAKLRVRQLLQSLEQYMKGDEREWHVLTKFLEKNPSETKAWFPFLQDVPRRMVPRLKDTEDDNGPDVLVPREIHVNETRKKEGTLTKFPKATNSKKTFQYKDDDSGISLDDLKCCICFKGDATDENDLLMCDGQGCFRAHHMQCHIPIITPQDVQDEDDWFCPLCTALAKLVAEVQSEYTGDEWYCEDTGSIASWDCVNDVFPEAPKEYEIAMKWKNNTIDAETRAFLKNMFGGDDEDDNDKNDEQGYNDADADDDDEDDDDFDPTETGKSTGGDDVPDTSSVSDTSSKATLGELSIELKIGRDELDALSLGGGGDSSSGNSNNNDDEDGANDAIGKTRRSRRVRSSRSSRTASKATTDDEKSTDVDTGKLDESNIIVGKRRRRKVDYALLNDSMFGRLSAKERNDIDDEVEFQYKTPKRRRYTSSESDDVSEDSVEQEEEEDDDDDDVDNEGSTSHEVSETSKRKNVSLETTNVKSSKKELQPRTDGRKRTKLTTPAPATEVVPKQGKMTTRNRRVSTKHVSGRKSGTESLRTKRITVGGSPTIKPRRAASQRKRTSKRSS
jgi:hypothetical protein